MELESRSDRSTPDSEVDDEKAFATVDKSQDDSCASQVSKFCDDSSFNTVSSGFRKKSWLMRILWACIVVLAIAGFVIVTIQGIVLLAREPTATSIKIERRESLDFPAVTVCSLNIINDTALRMLNTGNYDVAGKLNDLFTVARITPPDKDRCQAIANEAVSVNPDFNVNFGGLTSYARFYSDNLIQSCSYGSQEDCRNSFIPVNTVEGVCFTFNGPNTQPVRKANATGVRQGLRLQLSGSRQLISQSLEGDIGYKVVIHNPNEPPRPESEGIAVGLNSAAYISMKTVVSIDSTKFYSGSQCRGNDNEYSDAKILLRDYSTYSPSLCLYDCFYTTIADKCGCVERDLYTTNADPYKSMNNCTLTNLCCEIIEFDSFQTACRCPPNCDTIEHTFTVSSSTQDSSETVAVNIYFETLVVETRETTDSYTPWSLISDIGGNTGLFLGLDMLAFAELFMFAMGLVTTCCYRNKQRQVDFQRYKMN